MSCSTLSLSLDSLSLQTLLHNSILLAWETRFYHSKAGTRPSFGNKKCRVQSTLGRSWVMVQERDCDTILYYYYTQRAVVAFMEGHGTGP